MREELNVADNVRSEYSKIDPVCVWSIELIEILHSMKDPHKLLYVQYFMRSEHPSRKHIIAPVKTRTNQEAPLQINILS